MDVYGKNMAHRMGNAFGFSDKSDFYSSDGKTWDKYADDVFLYDTSDAYKKLLLDEAVSKESSAESLDDLSEQLSSFVLRIEARLEAKKNTPISRTYKTMIPYSYEDPQGGSRTKKYLDLKTLSDEDLQTMVGSVPEAQLEILYRLATGETNNNNK